jgi:predicted dehydrogenase
VTSELTRGTSPEETTRPRVDPTSRSGRRPLRVAIIGTGMIADVHRRAILLAQAELIGVLGSRPERSRHSAAAWGAKHAFTSIEQLVESDVDVVHVCSPNATHKPYVEAALRSGKHVVCEKPLGVSLVEVEQMCNLADQAGVVTTIPFVYRYHPVVREIRARAAAGAYGHWNLLHGHYLQDWLLDPRASNWRVDATLGGPSRAFADIGSHWCDLVEWLTGERLTSLVAHLTRSVAARPSASAPSFGNANGEPAPLASVGTEDIASLLFRTSNDVPGSVVVSQVSAGRKNRLWFELDGAGGSAAFDQESPEWFWSASEDGSQTVVRDPASGSPEQRRLSWLPAGHPQGYGDCFAAFVEDTYAAINGESRDGLPTFADGLRSARIVDAVMRSSASSNWTEV